MAIIDNRTTQDGNVLYSYTWMAPSYGMTSDLLSSDPNVAQLGTLQLYAKTGGSLCTQNSSGEVRKIVTENSSGNISVTGSIKPGNDSTSASSSNVGAIRYRSDSNNSYCEMVMQTGASTYAWVIIKQNSW